MTTETIAPRDRARQHLEAALATGVRGDLKDAIAAALALAAGKGRVGEVTDAEYRALKSGRLLDPHRPGLLFRTGSRGGARWIYRYAHPADARQVELVYGRYPAMSVAEARTTWERLRAQRLGGAVPSVESPSKTGPSITMGALCDWYLSVYAAKCKRPSSAKEDRRMIERHLRPEYADTLVTDFGVEEIAALLHSIEQNTPREAAKLRSLISIMIEAGAGRSKKLGGTAPILPRAMLNPARQVATASHAVRSHSPSDAEMSRYVRGLAEMGEVGDLLRVQVLTASRIAETTNMSWSEVDFETATWTLPAARSKNGRAHPVMLPTQSLALLRARHEAASGSPWVWPSPSNPNTPRNSNAAQHALQARRSEMGLHPDFTSHSTRHAALTWLAEQGCPRDLRDAISNHKGTGTDAIYTAKARLDAREWLQRWADHLDVLSAPNVVPITARG